MSDTEQIIGLEIGTGSYRILDSYLRRVDTDTFEDLRSRLSEALTAFPALSGETITVACRRNPDDRDYSRWNPYASAEPTNRIIRVPTHERCSNITLYHELAHCAIKADDENGGDHPLTSEEYCSLYALARQPTDRIDEERIPYFGEPTAPQHEWPEIARDALEYREENHDYIRQAKEWYGVDR